MLEVEMIETERLILREMGKGDLEVLLGIFADIRGFSREKMEGWITWNLRNYQEYGHGLWAMVLKETGEVIGDCGIVVQPVEEKQE